MDAADVLMSPDFGAFGGVRFQNENQLKGLEAQLKLGEIAGQPAVQRQREAHARLYEAEAAEKEAATQAQKRMGELMQGLPPGGSDTKQAGPDDAANMMIAAGTQAMREGYLKQGQDLVSKGTTVLQHMAATDASKASVDLRKARAADALLDQIGGLAMSATDQQSYDIARMSALNDPQMAAMLKQRGIDLSRLPASYEQAKPLLKSLASQAMSAKEQLAQQTRDRTADAEIKKDTAQAKAAEAAAGASSARARLIKLQEQDIAKAGGDTTGGARTLREARKEAVGKAESDKAAARSLREQELAARNAKRFPSPSAEQITAMREGREVKGLVVGDSYTTPSGVRPFLGKGPDGKYRWGAPIGTKPATKSLSTLPDEDDDELDD